MRKNLLVLCVFLSAVTAGGCGPLFPPATPPVYYQVQAHRPASVPCPQKKSEPLRVWPLNGAPPYDRTDFVILRNGNMVELSSRHRWIAAPGEMAAQAIAEVVSRARIFSVVDRPGSPGFVPQLHLGGHVREFAFRPSEGRGEAVLDVRVFLWRETTPKRLVFEKDYQFGEPVPDGTSPQGFAEAMNRAVARWLSELTRDLCESPLDGIGSTTP